MQLTPKPVSSGSGFTLVEVVISGVILAVVIGGLFSFVSQANTIARNGVLSRRAFQEVNRVLASPQFSHVCFDTLYNSCCSAGGAGLPCNVTLLPPLYRLGVLDERTLAASADNIEDTIAALADTLVCRLQDFGAPVLTIRVRAVVKWRDYSGAPDSISLEKIVTRNRG